MPSWLKVRSRMIYISFIDILLCLIYIRNIFELKDNLSFLSLILFLISLSGIWLFASYISDRLSIKQGVSKNEKIKSSIINTIKSFLISLFIIYLYIDIPYINTLITDYNNFDLLSYLLKLSCTSFLIITLIDLLINNFKSQKKHILIIGDSVISKSIVEWTNKTTNDIKYLFYNLDTLNSRKKLNDIIVINIEKLSEKDNIICKELLMEGFSIYTPASWFKKEFQRIPSGSLNKIELYTENWLSENNINSYDKKIKRFGDITLSSLILIIAFPILIISSIIIYLEDKGPVFYSQVRIGRLGQRICIWKLRTMCVEAEKDGPKWAKKEDSRITNIGKILRKTRIDELPQLISVFKGEMSLIGPRPERKELELLIEEKIPYYFLRHLVNPGLSGWAQVNYPYGASIEDADIKLSYDIFYIKSFSIWLDFLILFKTIRLVFNASGSTPKKQFE